MSNFYDSKLHYPATVSRFNCKQEIRCIFTPCWSESERKEKMKGSTLSHSLDVGDKLLSSVLNWEGGADYSPTSTLKLRRNILEYRNKQFQVRLQTSIFQPEESVLTVLIEGSIKRGSVGQTVSTYHVLTNAHTARKNAAGNNCMWRKSWILDCEDEITVSV